MFFTARTIDGQTIQRPTIEAMPEVSFPAASLSFPFCVIDLNLCPIP
jgi:hypothetical protein